MAEGHTITEKPSKSMRNTLALSFLGLLLAACNANTAKLQPDQPATTLPKKFSLSVPFTVQAPFADWGDPYQEACEEAALLIVHSYLAGNVLTKEQADKDLLALIAWEEQQGFAQDITLTELAEVAEAYYGYRAEVIQNPTKEEIQKQISLGNPVIVPAAGRMLGNPYFSGEGPWYHMLVITGYDGKRFITNDPGTRHGEGYKYKHQILMEAIHDWAGVKEEIQEGGKVALILSR